MRDMELQMKYKMKYIAISITIWFGKMGICGFAALNLFHFNDPIVKATCLVISIAVIKFLG